MISRSYESAAQLLHLTNSHMCDPLGFDFGGDVDAALPRSAMPYQAGSVVGWVGCSGDVAGVLEFVDQGAGGLLSDLCLLG